MNHTHPPSATSHPPADDLVLAFTPVQLAIITALLLLVWLWQRRRAAARPARFI